MSVFSQLMMRGGKIYAVIYGSPTNNDGVFSNFNDTNCLIINQPLPKNATEFCTKFTLPSTIPSSGTQFLFSFGLFSMGLYSKKIQSYVNGGYKEVIPEADTTGGSTYIVKCVIDGKSLSFSYSKDGGAFVNTLNITSTNSYNSRIRIGNSATSGRSFKGSIDIANTYIKIGNKFWYHGLYK